MLIDRYGRAYTNDSKEAYKYRVYSNNNDFKPEGAYQFEHLFHTEHKGLYVLPACLGKQYKVNPVSININTTFITLKDWQLDFKNELNRLYTNGSKTLMAISETATGKSYAMFGAIEYFKTTTCVVVPNKSIIKGLLEKFGSFCNMKAMVSSDIEKGKPFPDVLLITSASFNKQYNKINEYYNILLIDEIHSCPTKRIEQINKWKGKFICGLTATPQRKNFGLDGFKMLFGNIFKSGAKSLKEKIIIHEFEYDYSIKELDKASEGLAPGHPEIYRKLFINNKKRTQELNNIIKQLYAKNINKLMVFIDRKEHLKVLKKELSEYNIIEMSGDVDINKAIEQTKKLDKYVILGIIGCVKEGLDITDLQLGIMFVSTSRINTIVQAVGRMKRSDGKKDTALYIDFVDSIRFDGSKKKKIGYYSRRKLYKDNRYTLVRFTDFIK